MCKHSILNNSCKDCKDLKKEWDEYLEKMGFEDIEKSKIFFADHKSIFDLVYRKDFQTQTTFDAKVSYYSWARTKLQQESFTSTTDKIIWESHTEGQSTRQIGSKIGFDQSWIVKKLKKIREGFNELSSVSFQMATG